MFEMELFTKKEFDIIDITPKINEIIKKGNIDEGIAVIFTKHTTTALIINEDESRLLKDIEELFKGLIPKGKGYAHDSIDNNAHSHLRSILMNPSLVIPIKKGKLALGTWQSVLFIELDGPRRRRILIKLCKC